MTTYTIPIEDLAAYNYGSTMPDKLKRTRLDELELPNQVEVIYLNSITDYQQGYEYAQRQIKNVDGVFTLQLPISFAGGDTPAQIADIILYNVWTERVQYEITLPFKYVKLDASDRLSITLNNVTHLIRITNIDYEAPLLVKIKGVADETSLYTSNAVGGTDNQIGQTVPVIGATSINYLDIPMLRDLDNSSGYYAAASGYNTNWPGCVIYKSTDGGVVYNELNSLVTASTKGTTIGALGDTSYPWQWDYANTVNVSLISGTLSGETEINVLNGSNWCLVGSEIIAFKTATLEGDGTYTLSGLMRGLKGTDWATGTHVSGDRFILLDSSSILRILEDSSLIGTSAKYKAVTLSKSIADTSLQDFTNNAVCLKPYSPVDVKGSQATNGNWTFTWKRRTRFGGEWRDAVDATLNEDSEKYLVEIHSNPSASTIVNTLATVTSETATYTSAQVVTDFGSAQSNLTIGVFQLSETVGRGYIRKVTV